MSSRSSSASAPSSTASSGSSRIDLGKDESVNLGGKTQPSASSSGIGITHEVGAIGGLQIEGGVSIDVSPLELEVSSNGKDKISIAGSAEIPGGLLGIGGGVVIDTATGQIKGGSISGEVGGFGVEISKGEDGFGLGLSYQIPGTPIVITIAFGEGKKEEKPTPTPTPTPTPALSFNPRGLPTSKRCVGGSYELLESASVIRPVIGGTEDRIFTLEQYIKIMEEGMRITKEEHDSDIALANYNFGEGNWVAEKIDASYVTQKDDRSYVTGRKMSWYFVADQFKDTIVGSLGSLFWNPKVATFKIERHFFVYKSNTHSGRRFMSDNYYDVKIAMIDCEPPPECFQDLPVAFPPPPNPPPRREMDECCRESIRMLRNLTMVMQVRSVLEGKVQIPGELIAIPEEGRALPPEKLQTYPQMINAILLSINRHGMDAPITVEIEDTDKTAAGNQEAVYTYNSPAVAMQAALEMLHEIKAAGNARLSIQIGIAFAVTRILKIVGGIGESIREIIKMLGMPFRYKPKKMLLEFNLAGIKRGYGEDSKPKDFSEMSKEELESIIPTMLEGSECDIPVPVFTSSEADNVRQMLCKLTIRKEK